MTIWASWIRFDASSTLHHCSPDTWFFQKSVMLIRVRLESIRMMTARVDISNEKMPTGVCALPRAILVAMFSIREVFPTEGRDASTNKSPGWSPKIFSSKSNPVRNPTAEGAPWVSFCRCFTASSIGSCVNGSFRSSKQVFSAFSCFSRSFRKKQAEFRREFRLSSSWVYHRDFFSCSSSAKGPGSASVPRWSPK